MTDQRIPARRNTSLPSVVSEVMSSDLLVPGNHQVGFQRGVITRNTAVVDASTSYNLARARQSDSAIAVLDSRIRLARKYAEILDVPSMLSDEQREREHARSLSEQRRVLESVNAVHHLHMALAQHELELAKIREQGVRAQRNLEAARRVADVQVDSWYAQAAAQRNEAEATRQDTQADLQRPQSTANPDALKAAAEQQLAAAIASLEHQIELERERGNSAGVMALANVRARLRAA